MSPSRCPSATVAKLRRNAAPAAFRWSLASSAWPTPPLIERAA
ncbi:MAG: hypothetical protein ACKOGA_24920 [Planctomycetaceae bacterium]